MADHHQDHDNANNNDATDDADHRQAAHLRYHFQPSSSLWTSVQNAGWKYKAGEGYEAPNTNPEVITTTTTTTTTLSSNDVLRKLNQAAIVPLDNYLQIPPAVPKIDAWSERFRSELINLLPSKELIKRTGDGRTTDTTAVTTTASIAPSNQKEDSSLASRRQRQHLQRKGRSATTFDAGADLFLKQSKKNNKKNGKSQKKFLLDGGGGLQTHDSRLEFPTAVQIAEVYDDVIDSSSSPKKDQSIQHAEWKFLLCTNHSVLLYGFGSKQSLLNDFWKTALNPAGDVLAVDGFDRKVTVKDVLDLIVHLYLDNKEPSNIDANEDDKSNCKRAEAIGKVIATVQLKKKQPLYLVIHNIDGFRNRKDQHALSMLLSHSVVQDDVRTIRLVASVDHVNSGALLWDPETSAAFCFIWIEVNTFKPYIEELKRGMEQTKSRQSKRAKSMANVASSESIFEILNTIATKHTEVLKTLITLQLECQGAAVSYARFLKACTDKMIVTSDSNLRKYLTELLDHGIIEKSREGGSELLLIPHSVERLQDILEFEIN